MTSRAPDILLEALLLNQQKELERYGAILAPLFNPHGVNQFEFACALLRVGGMQSAGWDPLEESIETLADLTKLVQLDLEAGQFKDPSKTRWRLFLISYAHLVEMDAPYDVLGNLLRVRLKLQCIYDPFQEFAQDDQRKRKGSARSRSIAAPVRTMSPGQKISLIRKLATRANCMGLNDVFDEFYFTTLRNSIDHSDYVLHSGEFRMRNGLLAEEGRLTSFSPVIGLDRLNRIIGKAYGFYLALFTLERNARAWFAQFKGKAFPFDRQLKGLMEFLIDDQDLLCGLKVHWPNETDSIYRRLPSGCEATNILYCSNGTLSFQVVEYFQPHHPFSSLVPSDGQPRYTPADGSTDALVWPSDSRLIGG